MNTLMLVLSVVAIVALLAMGYRSARQKDDEVGETGWDDLKDVRDRVKRTYNKTYRKGGFIYKQCRDTTDYMILRMKNMDILEKSMFGLSQLQ